MQKEIQKKLINEYQNRKAKNSSYSLRAYSRSLGVPVSAISEIITKNRQITIQMGKRILEGLNEPTGNICELLPQNFTSLSLDEFHVVSEWYYFAILSLAETEDFVSDVKWISKRLNVSKIKIEKALQKLTRLDLLTIKDNKYFPTGKSFSTPSEIEDSSLKLHTSDTLLLAKDSLFRDSVSERDFSTVTMTLDPEYLDEAKKMIKDFRKKLMKKMESKPKKEVYKLSIQLFPISR